MTSRYCARAHRSRNDRALRSKTVQSSNIFGQFVVLIAFIVAMTLCAVNNAVLPAIYFNDSRTIQIVGSALPSLSFSSPFSSAASGYKLLHLAGNERLAGYTAVVLFSLCVVAAARRPRPAGMKLSTLLVAATAIALSGVYMSMFSKEFFVLPVVALLLWSANRTSSVLRWAWLGPAIAYAVWFRSYWYVVVVGGVGLYVFLRRAHSIWQVLLLVVAHLGLLVVAVNVFTNSTATYYRVAINGVLQTDRQSEIVDALASNQLLLQWANLVLIFASLLVPLPLIFPFSLSHLASGLLILATWLAFATALARLLGNRQSFTPAQWRNATTWAAFVLSFLATQSLFEPDYGSYLRHLVPVLPVVIAVVGQCTARDAKDPGQRTAREAPNASSLSEGSTRTGGAAR